VDSVSADTFSQTEFSDSWAKECIPPVAGGVAGHGCVESVKFVVVEIVIVRGKGNSGIDAVVVVVADFISDKGDVNGGAFETGGEFGVQVDVTVNYLDVLCVTYIDADAVMADITVVEQYISTSGEVRTSLVVVVIVQGAMIECYIGCMVEITAETVGMEKRVIYGAGGGGIEP